MKLIPYKKSLNMYEYELKAVYDKDRDWELGNWCCFRMKSVGSRKLGNILDRDFFKYCPYCGERIEWLDEIEK